MSEKEISARQVIADVLRLGPIGQYHGAPMLVACDIGEHLAAEGFAIIRAVPVDQWQIVRDEDVLIYVVHENAKYEKDPKVRREKWEAWCVGRWIKHNKGGWMWHGLCGQVTHVAPLPERPW